MKAVKCVLIVLCICVVIFVGGFLISWGVASNKDRIDYSDTWMSFRISESIFEKDVVDKISTIESKSRKNIYYGLYRIATKIDCEYKNEDKAIEFYVVHLTKGYHFSNVKFDTLVNKQLDGVGRETYICVNSNIKEDLELILSVLNQYM